MVHQIQSANEFEKLTVEGLAVVDFFATWCGPCRGISPVFEQLEKNFENVKFLKIDIDKVPEPAQEFSVSSLPTFLFFKDGKVVETLRGADPGKLQATLKQFAN